MNEKCVALGVEFFKRSFIFVIVLFYVEFYTE